jgi:hypothetical protein
MEDEMIKRKIEKFAVPMFTIGLLSLVLGIFTMSQSPANGATGPATQSITIRYLAPETNADGTNAGICPGQGRLQSDIPTGMLSPTQGTITNAPRPGFDYVFVDTCSVTFKALR